MVMISSKSLRNGHRGTFALASRYKRPGTVFARIISDHLDTLVGREDKGSLTLHLGASSLMRIGKWHAIPTTRMAAPTRCATRR